MNNKIEITKVLKNSDEYTEEETKSGKLYQVGLEYNGKIYYFSKPVGVCKDLALVFNTLGENPDYPAVDSIKVLYEEHRKAFNEINMDYQTNSSDTQTIFTKVKNDEINYTKKEEKVVKKELEDKKKKVQEETEKEFQETPVVAPIENVKVSKKGKSLIAGGLVALAIFGGVIIGTNFDKIKNIFKSNKITNDDLNEDNIRIDKYLSENTEYSRSYIEKLIDEKCVLVNGKEVKASYKVCLNDEIEINDTLKKESDIKPVKMQLNIVYEDDDLMIINKPSGLVVHPGAGNYDNTLVNGLLNYTNNLSSVDDVRPGIVHRLDKDTSGLMVVAKNNKCHELLSEMFKNHEVKRTYYALVCGVVPYNKGTVDVPLKKDETKFDRVCASEDGKKAITHFTVLKRYNDYTLLSLNLETGRTHQIRVHMAYMGYPVYNDPVYNNRKATEFGQFLHSKEIDFIHPISGKRLHFECELPKEFKDFIDNLK